MFKTLAMLLVWIVTLGPGMASETDFRSPVGLWQNYDDNTGQLRALVRIQEQEGMLVGRIEEVYRLPGDKDEDAVCHKCSDSRKGRPIKGMVIMTGLRAIDGAYEGGEILDPANGMTYRCKLRLGDNGRLLVVRGYIGFSLFGRSQTWQRAGEPQKASLGQSRSGSGS